MVSLLNIPKELHGATWLPWALLLWMLWFRRGAGRTSLIDGCVGAANLGRSRREHAHDGGSCSQASRRCRRQLPRASPGSGPRAWSPSSQWRAHDGVSVAAHARVRAPVGEGKRPLSGSSVPLVAPASVARAARSTDLWVGRRRRARSGNRTRARSPDVGKRVSRDSRALLGLCRRHRWPGGALLGARARALSRDRTWLVDAAVAAFSIARRRRSLASSAIPRSSSYSFT